MSDGGEAAPQAEGLWARLRAQRDRLIAHARRPEPPVLPAYHRQRTPFDASLRQWLFLGGLGLVGLIYGWYLALYGQWMMQYLLMPLALMALVVIWALPDQTRPPDRLMERFFWGFWLTLIVWPNYLAIALPGMPWITVNRLFGIPMLLMLLIAVSVSRPFRRDLGATLNALPLMWKMMVAFIICQLVALLISGNFGEPFSRFFHLQIVWTAIFFVSAYVFSRPGRITKWTTLIILMAIFLGLMALEETRRGHVLWMRSIPSFLKVEDESVLRVLQGTFRNGRYRVVGPYMSSLTFAEFLALASPFILHAAVTAKKMWARILLIAADVLIFLTIDATQARLGAVGFFMSHSIYGLYWGIRRWMTSRTSLLGPALTLAYPALLSLFGIAVSTIDRLRLMVLGSEAQEASNQARQAQYAMAPERILANPLGYGPGRSGLALGYRNAAGEGTIDTYYVSVALDYGILGFGLFYGMIVLALFKSAQISATATRGDVSYALPVSIALGVFVVIKSVLSMEANNPIMFMLLGMVVAMTYLHNKAQAGQGLPR